MMLKEFEKEQELERDKEKFLDEYKEVYLLVKILFEIFEKRVLRKQEDYDVISLGISPGRSQSCDVSSDFAL